MSEREYLDTETSDQLKNLLDAEQAYGDRLVTKVLRVNWTWENDENWLWSVNECHACDRPLTLGEEGFVWACPLGDPLDAAGVAAMQVYCSEKCVDEDIAAWAATQGKDVLTGYYAL